MTEEERKSLAHEIAVDTYRAWNLKSPPRDFCDLMDIMQHIATQALRQVEARTLRHAADTIMAHFSWENVMVAHLLQSEARTVLGQRIERFTGDPRHSETQQ